MKWLIASKENGPLNLWWKQRAINTDNKRYQILQNRSIAMKNFKVLFLAKTCRHFNFQAEVTAKSEAAAKIAARSELMVEGLMSAHYKKPVVTVVRPIQEVA